MKQEHSDREVRESPGFIRGENVKVLPTGIDGTAVLTTEVGREGCRLQAAGESLP